MLRPKRFLVVAHPTPVAIPECYPTARIAARAVILESGAATAFPQA